MQLMKTIAMLLLAGTAMLDTSLALARDSRNEPERPPIESRGGGGSSHDTDRDPQPERRLPKSSKGMICRVGEARNGVFYVSLINDTGAVIPAGSTVTVYVQPGNVEKLYKVDKDWQPGQKLDLPLKGVALGEDAACSVRVKLAEPAPTPDEPDEPQDGGEEPGGNDAPGDKPFSVPGGTITGDTGPLGDSEDPDKLMSAACVIYPWGRVDLVNSGNVMWPSGAVLEVTLPNGQVYKIWGTGFGPGGTAQIPDELLYYPGSKPDTPPFLPADWTCQIKLQYDPALVAPFVTGDTGPLGEPGEPLISAACLVYPAGGVVLANNGAAAWPAGTHLTVTLPNGQVFETTTDAETAWGISIPPELVYYPDSTPQPGVLLPSDWTCQIGAELPQGEN